MFNRSFARAAIAGALVALIALGAYFAIRSVQRPQPVPDFNPANAILERRPLDAPYVSSEYDIVRAMLRLAQTRPDDFVVDLGSGDGRIPIIAAREIGARGLGVDLEQDRIRESRRNARRSGVEEKVSFRQEDLFVTPLVDASVITLYLLPEINLRLRPRILAEARPGTRVVSNSFDMGDWRPDQRITELNTNIFLWIVPARVAGSWQLSLGEGGGGGTLNLQQRYQDVSGTLNGQPLRDVVLRGGRIAFTADLGQSVRRFEGQVDGGRMAGDGWEAVRTGG